MKEIKAYIRPDMAERVVDGLIDAGLSCMALTHMEGVGLECDPEDWRISVDYVRKYSKVVKLEIVCADEEAPEYVEIIRKNGHTGSLGDGMIFVSDVGRAVDIRTGEEAEGALHKREPESH